MLITLHRNATTTPRQRAYIKASPEASPRWPAN